MEVLLLLLQRDLNDSQKESPFIVHLDMELLVAGKQDGQQHKVTPNFERSRSAIFFWPPPDYNAGVLHGIQLSRKEEGEKAMVRLH